MVTPGIQAQIKLLLGITDNTQDGLILFAAEVVEERILHYINHETLPCELEKAFILMVVSYYKSANLGSSTSSPGDVASVKRGDVTTSFAKKSEAGSTAVFGLGGGEDGFFGWRSVLNEYRRLRW